VVRCGGEGTRVRGGGKGLGVPGRSYGLARPVLVPACADSDDPGRGPGQLATGVARFIREQIREAEVELRVIHRVA
jgi:hypothetical protein